MNNFNGIVYQLNDKDEDLSEFSLQFMSVAQRESAGTLTVKLQASANTLLRSCISWLCRSEELP